MGTNGTGRMTAFVSSSRLTTPQAKDYTWQYRIPISTPLAGHFLFGGTELRTWVSPIPRNAWMCFG
jgi:hypothetical protein